MSLLSIDLIKSGQGPDSLAGSGSRLLTTGEAAVRLGVKPDTVLKWIHRGRLPAHRTPGGHHRIDAAVVECLAAAPPGREARQGVALPDPCWEYFSREGRLREDCLRCVVYRIRAAYCFEVLRLGAELGHQRLFCATTCEHCPYYRRVHGQPVAVLVVTADGDQASRLRASEHPGVNLEIAADAYEASARIAESRPAAVLVDAALTEQERNNLVGALQVDRRIPWARVALAERSAGGIEQDLRAVLAELLPAPGRA